MHSKTYPESMREFGTDMYSKNVLKASKNDSKSDLEKIKNQSKMDVKMMFDKQQDISASAR